MPLLPCSFGLDPEQAADDKGSVVSHVPVQHYGGYTKLYTDAAIAPDQANQHMRKAGLGVFILEPRRKLMIHIKAIATANSVIMADADPRCLLPY